MRRTLLVVGFVLGCLTLCPLAEPLKALDTTPNLGVVRLQVKAYMEDGPYLKDVEACVGEARAYLKENLSRFKGRKPAIVLDIDETALSNLEYLKGADYGYIPQQWMAWIESGKAPALVPTLALYREARALGVAVFFLSAREEAQRNLTAHNLKLAGFTDYQGLILRPSGAPTSAAFKSKERRRLTVEGYAVIINLGDQWSDLEGGYAEGSFKLPNPCYYVP